MRVRGLSRSKAERFAFEIILIDHLNATHRSSTDPNYCAHCGAREQPGATLLPIGLGIRHTWLHRNCWVAWRIQRRARLKTISPAWAL
jgi:hypothetical protein